MRLAGLLFAFQGRANRRDFWLFQLGWLAVWGGFYAGLWVYLGTVYPAALDSEVKLPEDVAIPIGAVFIPLCILSAWAAFAVAVKRLHDQDRSGLVLLSAFIPVLGWAYLFVRLGFAPGSVGANRFGFPAGEPDPRRPASIVS